MQHILYVASYHLLKRCNIHYMLHQLQYKSDATYIICCSSSNIKVMQHILYVASNHWLKWCNILYMLHQFKNKNDATYIVGCIIPSVEMMQHTLYVASLHLDFLWCIHFMVEHLIWFFMYFRKLMKLHVLWKRNW